MESFVAWGILRLICWIVYKAGKRIGNRQGYGAGRALARRR